MDYASCDCFDQDRAQRLSAVMFHPEKQDTSCDGWKRLLELIEQAAADERETFKPEAEMTWEECTQIVTRPLKISKLPSVKCFDLYGSDLVRIPPVIVEMTSLEEFIPYTSYRLHWFPYEIAHGTK